MSDTQILTLALSVSISVLIPVSLLLINNSRMTDVKEALRSDIKALGSDIQKSITDAKTELRKELREDMKKMVDEKLELHEKIYHGKS